jgi:hypothetical protein
MAIGGVSTDDEMVSLADYSIHMFGDWSSVLFNDCCNIFGIVFSQVDDRELWK